MSATIIGFGTTSYTGTATSTFNFSSLVDISGAGGVTLQQDDMVLVALAHSGTGTRTNAQLAPTTAGYSTNPLVASAVTSSDTDVLSLNGFFKLMGASPDTSVVLPGCAASTNSMSVVIFVYRGLDTVTPLGGVTPTTVTAINGTKPDPPSVTTPASPPGCIIGGIMGQAQATGAALTAPTTTPYDATANYVKASNNTATTNDSAILIGHKTGVAINTAFNASAANGGTTANTDSSAAISFVLKPATVTQTLTPTLFTNSQSFPSATVDATYDLAPALASNGQTFYFPTVTPGTATLLPGLVASEAVIRATVVAPGPVALTPGIAINSSSVGAPVVVSTYLLTPNLLTNSPIFSAPAVSPGPVSLTPSLLSITVLIRAAVVTASASLAAALVTNSPAFPGSTVATSDALAPGLTANVSTFAAPTVVPGSVALLPGLVGSSAILRAPTVTAGSVTLLPPLFAEVETFAAPVVASGAVSLAPSLQVGTQTFPAALLSSSAAISPPALASTAQTYAPAVSAGPVALAAPLIAANDTFPPALVDAAGVDNVLPLLLVNAPVFHSPNATSSAALACSLAGTGATFGAAAVSTIYQIAAGLVVNVALFAAPVVTAISTLQPGLVDSTVTIPGPTIITAVDLNLAPALFASASEIFAPSLVTLTFGGLYVLETEGRSYVIDAGLGRSYVLEAEQRRYVLEAENRSTIVPRAA